jgi:hypothetical protein
VWTGSSDEKIMPRSTPDSEKNIEGTGAIISIRPGAPTPGTPAKRRHRPLPKRILHPNPTGWPPGMKGPGEVEMAFGRGRDESRPCGWTMRGEEETGS